MTFLILLWMGRTRYLVAGDFKHLLGVWGDFRRGLNGRELANVGDPYLNFLARQVHQRGALRDIDDGSVGQLLLNQYNDFLKLDGSVRLFWGRMAVALVVGCAVRFFCWPAWQGLFAGEPLDIAAMLIACLWMLLLAVVVQKLSPRHWFFGRGQISREGKSWLGKLFLGEEISGRDGKLSGVDNTEETNRSLLAEANGLQVEFSGKVQRFTEWLSVFDFFGNGVLVVCLIIVPLLGLLV